MNDHRLISFLLVILGLAVTLTMQLNNGLPGNAPLYLLPLFAAALITLIALNAGALIGRLIGLPLRTSEELLVGLLVLSSWVILLGSFHALYPLSVLVPLLLLLLTRHPRVHLIRTTAFLDDARAFFHQSSRWEITLCALIALGLSWGLLGALTMPMGMDALTYHLALPDQYIIRRSITPPTLGAYYLYWQQFEMACVPLLLLDRSGQSVNLINFLLLLIIARGCYRIGKIAGGREAGLLAAAAVASSPLILKLVDLTKNDLFATALVVGAALALLEHRPRSHRLFGLLAGGALATRPTAAFAVLPLFALLAWTDRRRLPTAVALAAILPGFWCLRNIYWLGTPLADGFYHDHVAGALSWSRHMPTGWSAPLAALHHLILAGFTRFSDGTDGPFGPLLLILVPAAFLVPTCRSQSRFSHRAFACAGLLGIALWSVAGRGQARFLLPLLITWSAFGAAVFVLPVRSMRLVLAVSLALTLGTAIALTESEDHVLAFLSRIRPVSDHMIFFLDTYPLQVAANHRLPVDACVATVGEAELFYLHRRTDYSGYWEPNRILSLADRSSSPEQLRTILRAHGYTHLLYNPRILALLVARGRTPAPPPTAVFRLEEMLRACPTVVRDRRFGAAVHEL